MTIHFTKHAEAKFALLKGHGFIVSKRRVIQTVKESEVIDHSRSPLLIAQKSVDSEHVLRVVYRVDQDSVTIITFYPGRAKQYGQKAK